MKRPSADRALLDLRRALPAGVPSTITQEAFDGDRGHLQRLIRLSPGQPADAGDLATYAHDLLYTAIDAPLLNHLLPACLQAWRDDLRGQRRDCRGFVEQFYPVLANRDIFETHLSPRRAEAVAAFIRHTILEEIDDQHGLFFEGASARPYRWIAALMTYGVLRDDLSVLWRDWWSLETDGRAVAALQFNSALLHPDEENPVFAPWTTGGGGGAPCLWQFDGHLYSHRWREANLAFLQQALTPDTVRDTVVRAADRLAIAESPEVAAKAALMRADLAARAAMLTSRCDELPLRLAGLEIDSPRWRE